MSTHKHLSQVTIINITIIFIVYPDLSPRAKPYCGLKCSQGLHFRVTLFNGKKDSSSTFHDLMKECDLVWYNTII